MHISKTSFITAVIVGMLSFSFTVRCMKGNRDEGMEIDVTSPFKRKREDCNDCSKQEIKKSRIEKKYYVVQGSLGTYLLTNQELATLKSRITEQANANSNTIHSSHIASPTPPPSPANLFGNTPEQLTSQQELYYDKYRDCWDPFYFLTKKN